MSAFVLRSRGVLGLVLGLQVLFAIEVAALYWLLPFSFGRPAPSLAPMLQNVVPGVVALRVTGVKKIPRELVPIAERPDNYRDHEPDTEQFRTGGSGVIIDPHLGHIITNNHVVENATDIDVGLSDGRHFPARIIGQDAGSDLALLKMEPTELPSIPVGNSDAVRVGDIVVAVGNPFGLEGTATLGIVSALRRSEIGHEVFEDYLQIDAQTNPGNSGGALVNYNGQLVGINTVIGGARGRGFTIGFAIPVNMAIAISREMLEHGRVRRGSTGFTVETLSQAGTEGVNHGAVVSRVVAGTSAASQGIKPGDIIVRAAGKPVRSAAEYMTRVSTVPIGGKIPIDIHADGKLRQVVLDVAPVPLEPTKVVLQDKLGDIAGLVVGDIMPGNVLYGHLNGAQILSVPTLSISRMAGLEVGDVIVGVDGGKISSTGELSSRIEQAGLQYRLDIVRNGTPAWVRMRR
jgi:serine protease DegQ